MKFEPMPSEEWLEDVLDNDISLLESNLLLIGRRMFTSFGKIVDLLPMDIGREVNMKAGVV